MPGYKLNEDGTLTITDEQPQKLFKPKGPAKPPSTGSSRIRAIARAVMVLAIVFAFVLAFLLLPDPLVGTEAGYGLSQDEYDALSAQDGTPAFTPAAAVIGEGFSGYEFTPRLDVVGKGLEVISSNFVGNLEAVFGRMGGELREDVVDGTTADADEDATAGEEGQY